MSGIALCWYSNGNASDDQPVVVGCVLCFVLFENCIVDASIFFICAIDRCACFFVHGPVVGCVEHVQ